MRSPEEQVGARPGAVIAEQAGEIITVDSDEPILDSGPEEAGAEGDEVVRKIREILDQQIRPAVAMDGGDILFVDFVDGVVHLKMQGACGGCPSSTGSRAASICAPCPSAPPWRWRPARSAP